MPLFLINMISKTQYKKNQTNWHTWKYLEMVNFHTLVPQGGVFIISVLEECFHLLKES